MDLRAELSARFGHEEFRPYQEEIITRVMAGRSVLGVLPTGAGKSLCYQLPALLLPRPTLVISPLIALMKDQLDGLPPSVYPQATLFNSSVDAAELEQRAEAVASGRIRLLYAAPERLRQQGFLRLLQSVQPSMVVVDEAHCVGVWGHDFRPDYLFIRKALEMLAETGETPILLALTATATPEMQDEIAAQLGRPLERVTASSFRPNLKLEVFPCANAEDKMQKLATVCRETPGAAVVYANSRDRCEKLAVFLRQHGLQTAHYHAGMERSERQETQERFMLGRTRIIVATVAFGMGVDKANVRLVVHFSLPESLEAYTQEAGRAGRDGKPSRCVLLYAPADKANLSRWLRQEEISLETVRDTYRALTATLGRRGQGTVSTEALLFAVFGDGQKSDADTTLRVAISLLEKCGLAQRHPDRGRDMLLETLAPPPNARADLEAMLASRRQHGQTRMEEMFAYVEGSGCRHVAIARHFGQELAPCGDACDVCLGIVRAPIVSKPVAPSADALPDIGRVILEGADAMPFACARTGLAKALTGAPDSPFKPERFPLHGKLAGFTLNSLRGIMDTLIANGLLENEMGEKFARLHLTSAGRIALQGDALILANPNRSAVRRPSASPYSSANPNELPDEAPLTADEDDRFEQLRAWRRIQAERYKVPPYVIFHDTTLRAIARLAPTSLEELSAISGIGPRKLEIYGPAVIALLLGEEPPDAPIEQPP